MINAGVVGAAGYTGQALLKILLSHPEVTTAFITSETFKGKLLSEVFPLFSGQSALEFEGNDYPAQTSRCDVLFLCLPHRKSMGVAKIFLDAGKIVFDLSADFRLDDAGVYEKWYGAAHTSPELLKGAVYGLPELYKKEIATASLIAVPGCYPTSAILGLAPAIDKGLIDTGSIVINSVSGVSGAGRTPRQEYMLAELEGNFWAYGAPSHRHTPEIEQELSKLNRGASVTPSFIPHLLPVARGIYTTITAKLKGKMTQEEAYKAFSAYYMGQEFVSVCDGYPQMKWAVGTNRIYIGVKVDQRAGNLIVTSSIDNLIKGAGGQAVQCFNIRFGFAEGAGL